VDHGKTALITALTGTNTDRLKEERERGISIELGFAEFVLGDGIVLGVVDMPGHERFVKQMVAGAGGVDLAFLVVAADEGVMPQTREHVAICELLGIERGVVALTKADLVDEDLPARLLTQRPSLRQRRQPYCSVRRRRFWKWNYRSQGRQQEKRRRTRLGQP